MTQNKKRQEQKKIKIGHKITFKSEKRAIE